MYHQVKPLHKDSLFQYEFLLFTYSHTFNNSFNNTCINIGRSNFSIRYIQLPESKCTTKLWNLSSNQQTRQCGINCNLLSSTVKLIFIFFWCSQTISNTSTFILSWTTTYRLFCFNIPDDDSTIILPTQWNKITIGTCEE